MAENRSLNDLVEVELWVVVMAIRYGQHRWSYASGDAVALAEEHWDRFPQFIRNQMLDDWKFGTTHNTIPPDDVAARWEALRKREKRRRNEDALDLLKSRLNTGKHGMEREDPQGALVCYCGLTTTDSVLFKDHVRVNKKDHVRGEQ